MVNGGANIDDIERIGLERQDMEIARNKPGSRRDASGLSHSSAQFQRFGGNLKQGNGAALLFLEPISRGVRVAGHFEDSQFSALNEPPIVLEAIYNMRVVGVADFFQGRIYGQTVPGALANQRLVILREICDCFFHIKFSSGAGYCGEL
jgi:hypothetical protein